jgi:hypothetical protein
MPSSATTGVARRKESRMSRVPRWLALGALAAGTLAAVTIPTSPASADPGDWCSAPSAAPCIESVTRDGVPVLPTDPAWQVDLGSFDPGHDLTWNLKWNGAYELPSSELGHHWTVVVDTGTVIPRVVYGNGRHGDVVRTDDGDGTYHISLSAETTQVPEGCAASPYPWPCPTQATQEPVRFGGQVTDWSNWTDPVQRAAFYGVDFWTDIEVNSFPPGVVYHDDTGVAEMRLDFAAPHFLSDGTTVFHGHFETVLPNDFLHENFFIPSPGTMTPGSLAVAGSGPVSITSITKDSATDPMRIDVSDMTFTVRKLRVKTGVIVPTRPRGLTAKRVSAHKARLAYELARPRGARITGYAARCVSPEGDKQAAKLSGNESPLKATELREGVRYDCRVRALSKAGPGPWSAEVKVPRRP